MRWARIRFARRDAKHTRKILAFDCRQARQTHTLDADAVSRSDIIACALRTVHCAARSRLDILIDYDKLYWNHFCGMQKRIYAKSNHTIFSVLLFGCLLLLLLPIFTTYSFVVYMTIFWCSMRTICLPECRELNRATIYCLANWYIYSISFRFIFLSCLSLRFASFIPYIQMCTFSRASRDSRRDRWRCQSHTNTATKNKYD